MKRYSLGFMASGMVATLAVGRLAALTYAPPAKGDYGGSGPYAVAVETFANPAYPMANGAALTVSVYHPDVAGYAARPTIFFAHGYTSPVGNAQSYAALLAHLASRGYNVVFSPYEGGNNPSLTQRFDELVTGFTTAADTLGLNVAQAGFAGHSYGGGLLPAVVRHLAMGAASQYRAGRQWGSAAAFMFSMAPAYALDGGGDTAVSGAPLIVLPPQLNVIEQVYFDDQIFTDPRLAIDVFYNVSTPNRQKDFLTVYGDAHGFPAQTANHLLPNTLPGQTNASLQAWAVLRHLDALAAYTFTGDATAGTLALGNGADAQTYEGAWSDGQEVARLGVTDVPDGNRYPAASFVAQWDSAANPRRGFPLVSGGPRVTHLALGAGQIQLTAGSLLIGHAYTWQTTPNLAAGPWTGLADFTAAQTSQTFPFPVTGGGKQFWRVVAP